MKSIKILLKMKKLSKIEAIIDIKGFIWSNNVVLKNSNKKKRLKVLEKFRNDFKCDHISSEVNMNSHEDVMYVFFGP